MNTIEDVSFWTAMASIIVALGGWRFTKQLFNRDAERRKAEASAKASELEVLRRQIDWMEQKYKAVSEKLDELYEKFRKAEERELKLIKEKNELLVALRIAEYMRCEVPDSECGRRYPPRDCTAGILKGGKDTGGSGDGEATGEVFSVSATLDRE